MVAEVVVAQDDDMEEEEDEAEDSCGDGFVVPNGYISDDEGVASVQQDLDDLAAELDGALCFILPDTPVVLPTINCK